MIWNCIDRGPWSFNRDVIGERKDGTEFSTWTPYREINNKKNNFSSFPRRIQERPKERLNINHISLSGVFVLLL